MAKSFVQRVAEENAQLKHQLRNVSASSRLANASLEDEPLDSFDVDGNLKATFGRQPDGSHGGLVRDSGPQPTLTAPDLTEKELGALAVVWDGKTTDGELPLVHGHTDILYARSEDGSQPALSEYRKAPSTIRDRDGGGTTVVCSPPGTWYVRLQLVGQDRVTKGEPSEATSVEIEAKVDRQEMLDKLAEGERLIEEAREDLALGEEERAQRITELETRQTELTENLALGLDHVYDQAEARAQELADSAVVQAAGHAQELADDAREIAERALAASGNLVRDGGFDDPTLAHWPEGAFSGYWSPTGGRKSASSYRVDRTSSNHYPRTALSPTEAGRVFYAEAFFKREGTATKDVAILVQFRFTSGTWSTNWVARTPGTEIPEGSFKRVAGMITAPENVEAVRFAPWIEGPQPDAVYIVDDVRGADITESAEALAKAQLALEAANAAHTAAGSAESLASQAMNRAGSIGGRLGGTTPPVGTAPENTLWFQWDHMKVGRTIVGFWKREGGEWVAQPNETAAFALLDIGAASIGDLEFDRIRGVLIEAQKVLIGRGANLIPNASLTEGDDGRRGWNAEWGRNADNGPGGTPSIWLQGRDTRGSDYFPVEGGQRYRFRVMAQGDRAGKRFYVQLITDGSSNPYMISNEVTPNGTWGEFSGEFTVPDNATLGRIHVYANHGNGTTSEGYQWFRGWQLYPMLKGVLIEDNGITSPKVNTAEFFSAEAVIQKIWTEIVRARLVQSVGIITEDMVATESVTTPKLKVTEDMVAKFAQILHLVADQVEMNNFIAGSGMVGLLEAIGLTLSDEAGGRRTEVSGAGISVIDTATGTPEVQLGTFSNDLLTLRDRATGDVSLSMGNEGSLSAVKVSSEQDVNIAGKSLMGSMFSSPQSAATTSVLDALGWGASRVLVRTFTGTTGPGPRGIAHIEAKVVPGRIYRIVVPDFQMGDNQDYYMSAYYTTSSDPDVRPVIPRDTVGANLGTVPSRNPPIGYGWPTSSLSYEKIYTPTTAQWIRIQFVVGRFSGGGNLVQFGNSNSIATNPRFMIEDLGPRVGDGGVTTWRDPSSTTDFAQAPDIVTQPYPVTETATYTWNPSTGVATRQGINVEPRFGYWPNGLYYLTLARFNPWSQGGAFYNADVSATVKRWATSSGQVLQSGLLSTTGSPPASFNSSATNRLPDLVGVGAGSTRLLGIDPDQAEAQAAQTRAVAVFGWSGWTGSSQNNAAAGVLNRDKTYARLHTTTATNDG